MRIYLLLLISILWSCKRSTDTYPIPDRLLELEAAFPYKDIKKPLVFLTEFQDDSLVFTITSEQVERIKNTDRPSSNLNVSRLQKTCSISIQAKNFRYELDDAPSDTFRIEHSLSIYSFYVSLYAHPLELGTLMAGSDTKRITYQYDSLTYFGKLYADVIQLESTIPVYYGDVWVSQIQMNETNGLIAIYDAKYGIWYYLKPQ